MKTALIRKAVHVATAVILTLGMTQLSAQSVGEKGPDFEVDLQGGGTFKLSDQRGKVVFVFLFGNACGACRSVAPTVESSIYQAFKNNSAFTAVGLDTWDNTSNESSVSYFRNSTGLTFPLAIKANSVAASYSTTFDRLMVIDQNGVLVHKVSLPASNDIENAIAAINQSLATVGVRDFQSSSVSVFPVPARDVVQFESVNSIHAIRIFDISGKLLLESNYGSGNPVLKCALSLGHLDQGLYFYSVRTGISESTGKLVIQE